MVCGGNVRINFYYINHEDANLVEGIKKAHAWTANNENFYIIESVEKGISFVNGKEIVGSISTEVVKELNADLEHEHKIRFSKFHNFEEFFIEHIKSKVRVILFGGGHISESLAPLLTYLDFDVLVCDDREEFLTEEKFPTAQRLLIDFNSIDEFIDIEADDYLCVLTRGHKFDEIIQAQALKTNARYIGSIGSKRKKQSIDMRLRDRGFSDEDIDRITSPIGIDIACETPREIGISIAAQLVDLRLRTK